MIRFAIWAAVSTEQQAATDKVSLEVQETKCREVARGKGWVESSGPYVVAGESRQRYVNLRDAEIAIPELHALLDQAQAGKYDVLVMYDYNRLRDLLDLVSKSLAHYKVQIYSVSQPIEPVEPVKYSPYVSDVSAYMELFAKMTSRIQNNDLRRKYSEAMPRRVSQRGLPAGGQVPFGYIRGATSKLPPTVDRERADMLIKAKNMLLNGQSTTQIAEWLETTGFYPRSGRWYPNSVKLILCNPFYAGILRWGVSKSELDPRTGRTRRDRKIPLDKIITGKGLHEPIWSEAEHRKIIAEFARRGHSYKGRATQRLTSLLSCGICGARLWVFYNTTTKPENMVWRCSSRLDHVSIRDTEALRQVANAMVNDLMRMDAKRHYSSDSDELRTRLLSLRNERARIGDAYQAGAYSIEEFLQRSAPIDEQLVEAERKLSEAEGSEQDWLARERAIYYLQENIKLVPEFLEQGDKQEVNHVLRAVLYEAVVDTDGVRLRWR